MKKVVLLLFVLALGACDRPQYDMQMVCGSTDRLLIDAKIYKSHADLAAKRLTKDWRARARGEQLSTDHIWLYNQVPNIDDVLDITLPAGDHDEYEVPGKIKLELGHYDMTGGLYFMLWHAADNNLTRDDGEKIPDGQYTGGIVCHPVLYPRNVPEKIPVAQRKEIKNCLSYLDSQVHDVENTVTEKGIETRIRVYDENTGREMYIGNAAINEIFNGIEPYHFYFENMNVFPDDVMQACDVAARLRAYIAAHIDAEYIPEPKKNEISISSGETMTLTCDDEEIVIRGE